LVTEYSTRGRDLLVVDAGDQPVALEVAELLRQHALNG